MGRLHDVGQSFKAFLSATATGILLFLFWDVLTDAIDPVEAALHASNWGRFSWLAALAFGGFAIGPLTLVYYDSWMKARRRKSFLGPGAASAGELERSHFVGLTPARWLALFIATGIGLHNFSEGLAIGQAAALDKLSLAYVLVIGFGLHNATEGFGIVAPLTGDAEPPSWHIGDRKSTRLNSSHMSISYAVFCLKKKKQNTAARPAAPPLRWRQRFRGRTQSARRARRGGAARDD